MGAVARARDRRRGGWARRPLPLRPLPLDHARRPSRLARRLDDARRRSPRDTERLRLGTMVSPVTFRPASVLAKAVATVDHISNGRVELGIGAGWFEAEHADVRLPVPDLARAARRARPPAGGDHAAVDGGAATSGRSRVQQPRPPIIVGGRAKPRTVRAAVRYADEYNTVFPTRRRGARTPPHPRRGRSRGRPRAAAVLDDDRLPRRPRRGRGRDAPGPLREVVSPEPPPISGTVDQVVEQLRAYEAVGVERAMLQHLVHEDVDMVTVLGDVAARLR